MTTKFLALVAFFSFTVSFLFSQQEQSNYWESLLMNNRDLAHNQINSEYKANPTLETLLAREIIRSENGIFTPSKNFLSSFLSNEEFEPYLFALWNEKFIFDSYLTVGFYNDNIHNINAVLEHGVKNPTLKEDLYYLKGITERHLYDFESYNDYMKKMSGINEWQFCGAFENLNNSGLDVIYEPEYTPYSEKDFNANSNGFLNWYNVDGLNDGYVFLGNHSEYGSGVNYAQTFFNNETEREAIVKIGCSSKFKIWLNDVLLFENTKDVDTDLDAYSIKINLPKGQNRLLIKLAESSSYSNFIVRITDLNGESLNDLKYSNIPQQYEKSTFEKIKPQKIDSYFETYFKEKHSQNPDDFLTRYCLILTYLRNQKYEEAKELITPLYNKYPKSSILRRLLISVFLFENDSNSITEMIKNLEQDDKNYFLSLTYKIQNVNELFRMSVEEMNEILDAYETATDNDIIKLTTKMMKSIRVEDRKSLKSNLDKLFDLSLKLGSIKLLKGYAPLYGSVLSDEEKSITIMENLNQKYFDMDVRNKLVGYYIKQNKKDKAIELYKQDVANLPNDLDPLKSIVHLMHEFELYKESLPYIDQLLTLYPYSFVGMEMKGDALFQLNKKTEAIEFYKQSLIYNTGNSSLRRKIRDISNQPDLIKEFKIDDVYAFIKEHRGKITENNYGYNYLLDEGIVELYEEAGGKSRYVIVYEVTSSKGVENLKEYNLGLWSNYSIIKSEIVKPNGTIVPAERSGSEFVFNGLEIGDIIYIDYQLNFNGYGRFYKDFVESYQMDTWHPEVLGSYTLIVPNQIEIIDTVLNGKLDYSLIEKDNYKVHQWKLENNKGLSLYEEFMPQDKDVARTIHISTIKDWSQIAHWYSDLVRPQLEINATVQETFNKIFESVDISKLSEEEKVRKIYFYMMNNLTYSFVDFKQSGYVPQKPSKVINSKMGDCKDFSALFLTFARMADLEANMVLVLTSDNAKTQLVLPSQEFNHCIARVKIDGVEQYLELTDKNLPFKSIPRGLRNASVLNIPYTYGETTDKSTLIKLQDINRTKNSYRNTVNMNIEMERQTLSVESVLKGAVRSYYTEELSNPNYKIILEVVKDEFDNVTSENMEVDSVYNIFIDKEADSLSFKTDMTINEKTNKIGSFKILKIPYIANAYNSNIISNKERKYPIEYLKYEAVDEYITVYNIHLEDGEEFMELPEDLNLKFKDHSYSRTYKKVGNKDLVITVIARPGLGDILPQDYAEYKSYVSKILEAKDEFIGFR